MKEKNKNKAAPDETVSGTCEDCGVLEEQFPHLEKCCRKLNGPGGANYKEICPNCTVWLSPPDPATLEIAVIFECPRYGYGKRIIE